MLFDLRGKRRRAVQATYLTLAVLMGGGLVLFGIGGSGGNIFDAFDSGGGGATENEAILANLVKLNYQAAVSQTPSGSTRIGEDGKDDLREAAKYWERYVAATDGQPDPTLAQYAFTVFNQDGLNQPAKAKEVVRVLAADRNDFQTYLLLVQYATAANDTRTAKLAATKAVDLAPKNQRKEVQKAAKQLQTAAPQQQ
jgi:hypothetical protein